MESSGFLPLGAGSTGATVHHHTAFGVHFALVVEAERLLWLPGQRGALLLIFIKRQATTAQGFKGQLPGFFGGIRTRLRRRMGRTSGKESADNY